MATKKLKKSIYLPKETWEMLAEHQDHDINQSISQFVDYAVRFYCCSLDKNDHTEILGSELAQVIKANIKNAENHIAASLFKLAGEQATLNLILADEVVDDMTDTAMKEYRNDAYDIVRRRRGVFTFEDAIDNARSLNKSGDR